MTIDIDEFWVGEECLSLKIFTPVDWVEESWETMGDHTIPYGTTKVCFIEPDTFPEHGKDFEYVWHPGEDGDGIKPTPDEVAIAIYESEKVLSLVAEKMQ